MIKDNSPRRRINKISKEGLENRIKNFILKKIKINKRSN